ncbi:MAG: hypothetical protein AB8D78_14120 [Akkermansiaceae bacterium]
MILTSLVWVTIGGVGYWFMNRGLPDFEVAVDLPETVTMGEVFKMEVAVKNVGSSNLTLADLDVYSEFLDGFEIVSVDPKPRSTSHTFGILTHGYSEKLAPSEVFEVEFELRATAVGYWGGDIDACTPTQNYVTHYTEIDVVDVMAPEDE